MYQAHFGLKKGLFDGGIAHEDGVFVGPRQQVIVANFKVALTTHDSVIVLTGAAGGGKTTLTSTALRTTSTRLALGWLSSTPTNGPELVELLLAEFGLSAHRVGRVERLQMWRQFLNEMSTTDSRVFVIAEHADEMETEVLRTLEGVTAADPNGGLGANLILLGQPDLNDRLKALALASLNQRVRLRQHLPPFSVEELEAYLKHRVALAGGTFDTVFARDAIGALQQYSGGLPRVVNNLCETALTLAATGAEQRVTQQLVTRVAIGLYGIDAAGTAAPAAFAQPASAIDPAAPPPAPQTINALAAAPRSAPAMTTAPAASAALVPQPAARPAAARASPDLPVLTDAVEAPGERKPAPAARTEPKQTTQQLRREEAHPARREAPPPAPAPAPAKAAPAAAAKPASAAPPHSTQAAPQKAPAPPAAAKAPPARPLPAHEPARPPAAAASAQAAPARLSATNSAPGPDEAELVHQTETMRALAGAKSIEDISNSMAETLFGEADLDMLSAALASAGWSDDNVEADELLDELAATSVDISATMETPKGKFDSFGQIPDMLELVDDSPTGKNRAQKIAGKR